MQNGEFYRNSTVLSEIKSACNGVEMDFDETKLDFLLNKFEMSDKKKVKIKNGLSDGEKKIVQILCSLFTLEKTKILLLDEPLNHLSFKNSKIFNDIMLEEIKKKNNLTIIMISHCKPVNFVECNIYYDKQQHKKKRIKYKSYDCVCVNN